MNETPIFGLVSPDETDSVDPEVYTAQMQQSVEDSIGARLLKQEKRVGIRATLGAVTPFTGTILPITTGHGFRYSELNFITGMTLSGGAVTVLTSGLYSINCVLTLGSDDGIPVDFNIRINGEVLQVLAMLTRSELWVSGTMTDTVYLQEGDTVTATAGVGNDDTRTATMQGVFFAMAMHYAT